MNTIHEHRRHNTFQTVLLLGLMGVILSVAGWLFFGWLGVWLSLVCLGGGLLFAQPVSSQIILRTFKARPIDYREAPELVDLFGAICRQSGLETLPLYYIPSRLPNAFAAGSGKQAFIAVSDGLLRILNRRELAGVLAHEVAHVINQDIRVMGLADSIARTTSALARLGLMVVFLSIGSNLMGLATGQFLTGAIVLLAAPALLTLLQLAISRTREFDADLGAAEITGDPLGLAMALRKLENVQKQSLLQRLLSPGPKRTQPAMLRTHPPTDERIDRLKALAEGLDTSDRQQTQSPTNHSFPNQRRIRVAAPRVRRRPRYHFLNGMWY